MFSPQLSILWYRSSPSPVALFPLLFHARSHIHALPYTPRPLAFSLKWRIPMFQGVCIRTLGTGALNSLLPHFVELVRGTHRRLSLLPTENNRAPAHRQMYHTFTRNTAGKKILPYRTNTCHTRSPPLSPVLSSASPCRSPCLSLHLCCPRVKTETPARKRTCLSSCGCDLLPPPWCVSLPASRICFVF